MTFHVGQKVVCVDDDETRYRVFAAAGLHFDGNLNGLKKGAVYTVRAVGHYAPYPGLLCLWLVEIERPIIHLIQIVHGEAPYVAARFRPVVERKTDISIFVAMLDRAPSAPVVTPQKELETQ